MIKVTRNVRKSSKYVHFYKISDFVNFFALLYNCNGINTNYTNDRFMINC